MARVVRRVLDRRALLRLGAIGLVGAALTRADGAAAGEQPEHLDVDVWIPPDIGAHERWVAVNIAAQAAVAMYGDGWAWRAWVTTGDDGWDTPQGEHWIVRRVYNETMTSAAIGIPPGSPDSYHLTDVLFTQYFTYEGHALHLNYWRPDWVFGAKRTSHGCVGMRYDDAAYFWRHVGVGNRVVVFG
jgi:lipoprotein-anchoring transpeptidase ErfK/SrfK